MTRGLTPAAVRASFAAAPPPGRRGDDVPPPPDRPRRPASVLVPLLMHADGLQVLLTRRTPHLSAHAGQVAFPGGRSDEHDLDATATALRESEEEIGLPPSRVEVVGRLDLFNTGTGFAITPIVGLIAVPFPLRPNPSEVAATFEVPLDFILDPANRQRRTGERNGRLRSYFVFDYGGHEVWGATAAILVNLTEILAPRAVSS
ncbi:MAG TPA: CoA pyrophosphatase [Stellaceae bacterium]|jgi:8-oxo-dGTP pyrophosphatase MutT (NUDIX family)|nr:CoA pyrophosphatase [Stellaceae bacterium]